MTYSPTKFEVATSNGLGGDTFTRNVTDGRTHGRTDGQTDGQTDGRTDGRRTDFDTKLIYPFFLKKKAGIIMARNEKINTINWSAHEMMVRITSACDEGSGEPACTHDLARVFASRINKVCKLKKTLNNF